MALDDTGGITRVNGRRDGRSLLLLEENAGPRCITGIGVGSGRDTCVMALADERGIVTVNARDTEDEDVVRRMTRNPAARAFCRATRNCRRSAGGRV